MADDPMVLRLRAALDGLPIREQKMFGGTCFMLSGNMLVGTSKRGLLVRVGKDAHANAVSRPHAKPMEMGGRAMEGYVFVAPEGTGSAKDLKAWIGLARAFVETLPPKAGAAAKTTGMRAAPKMPAKKSARRAS
jgi:hypothetical protein